CYFGLWLSLVERLVRDQEAVGSNPTSPISTTTGVERSPRRQAVGSNPTSQILTNCGCGAVATVTGRPFKAHQCDINHRRVKDDLMLRVTQRKNGTTLREFLRGFGLP